MYHRDVLGCKNLKTIFVLSLATILLFVPYKQSYTLTQMVMINELEYNPRGSITDNQWIEIMNMGEDMLHIGGWQVKSTKLARTYTIPDGFIIRPNDYLVIPLNFIMFGLENESAVLLTDNAVEVDRTPLFSDTYDDDLTWQRFPDGRDTNSNADWTFTNSTFGKSNGFSVAKQTFTLSAPLFIDQQGNKLQASTAGKMAGVMSEIVNESAKDRAFVYIVKISDNKGVIMSLAWVEDIVVSQNKRIKPVVFWLAHTRGAYYVETFVWRSFALPEPLVPQQSGLLRIAG